MKVAAEIERDELITFWIAEIEDYMRPSDFQREFFESLSDQFSKGKRLTDKQKDSLEKVYERVTR